MKTNYSKFLELLKPVLWQASNAVMNIYNQQSFTSSQKADLSPITEADLISHNILTKAISLLDPSIPIISEENKSFKDISRSEHYWVIDPLDGTKEFIAKNGEFTINVALVKDKNPVMGLVMVPVFAQLYHAIYGHGAFCEDKFANKKKITAAYFDEEQKSLNILCSRSHLNQETEDYINRFKDPTIIKKGGSMKFMDIARGSAHIYPRFGPTMEWDTCAPQIIVEEAGGSLIDQTTNQRMEYGKAKFLNNYFVVYAQIK